MITAADLAPAIREGFTDAEIRPVVGAMGVLPAGVFATSPKAVDQAVIMGTFPQMFLSGAIIPIRRSNGWLEALVRIMPATYLVDRMRAAASSGTSVYGIFRLYAPWVDLVVLPAVLAAVFVVGTIIFSRRERNRLWGADGKAATGAIGTKGSSR